MTANQETANQELEQRWQQSLMDNYGLPRLPLVRGEGARFWDAGSPSGTGPGGWLASRSERSNRSPLEAVRCPLSPVPATPRPCSPCPSC